MKIIQYCQKHGMDYDNVMCPSCYGEELDRQTEDDDDAEWFDGLYEAAEEKWLMFIP